MRVGELTLNLRLQSCLLCAWRTTSWARPVSSKAAAGQASSRAEARLVDFQTIASQAVQAFQRYQQQRCHGLHATDVLPKGCQPMPLFLPFWVFKATVSAECKATLGHRADKDHAQSPISWRPMAEWKEFRHRITLPTHEAYMQVYASFQHRRDLAEAAKLDQQQLAAARHLHQGEHAAAEATTWVRHNTAGSNPNSNQAAGRAFTSAAPSTSSTSDTSSVTSAGDTSSTSASTGSSGGSSSSGHSRPQGAGNHRGRYATTHSTTHSAAQSKNHGSNSTSNNNSSSSSSSNGQTTDVVFDPVEMRRPMAWALCFRAIKHRLLQEAVGWLKATYNADEVQDLQVNLRIHHRSSTLVYAPAYWLQYTYGVQYTPGRGDIVPEHFEMLVGGTTAGRVAADLHPSSIKVQAASAAAVAAFGFGLLPALEVLLRLEPASISMGLVDGAFFAFLAAAAGGLLAKALPRLARNQHMAAQAAQEKVFFKQYDQRESAPHAPPDAHTLWLWTDQDWRRWEGEAPWDWDPPVRRQWGEDLWRQQLSRLRERERAEERQRLAREQREADEATEEARTRKFGSQRSWSSHGHQEGGHQQHHHAGHGRRRRRDFLGYYKIMGVDPEGEVSEELIKSAFKKAALQLHPDTQTGADDAALSQAADKFRRLQTAYEVLRDPKRRQSYDAGRLMQ